VVRPTQVVWIASGAGLIPETKVVPEVAKSICNFRIARDLPGTGSLGS
jgi:hypothetical protein